jgi:hypothetical protein
MVLRYDRINCLNRSGSINSARVYSLISCLKSRLRVIPVRDESRAKLYLIFIDNPIGWMILCIKRQSRN